MDAMVISNYRNDEKKTESIDWDLSAELYDRAGQQKALKAAYGLRRKLGKQELLLITGASGTGKSVLARSIRTRVEDDWGFFISGKFDAHIHKPHAPFISAVEEFVKQVQLRGDHVVRDVRESIRDAVGSEAFILLEVIPQLNELLTTEKEEDLSCTEDESYSDDSSFKVGVSSDNPVRFVSVFCRFMRAICGFDRPLILLLDDLQWADSSSLEILSALLDPSFDQIDGLMVLGTCRGNEVGKYDNLSFMLRSIEDRGTTIAEIQVTNLTVAALARMIADALELSTVDAMPLAEIVHSQTSGNAFFAKQYIRSLLEEGILYKAGRRWTWDEAALILALPSAANGDLVIQLLAKKLQQLPSDVVETVKVISCMGTKFTKNILFHAGTITSSQVLFALDVASDHGFIVYDVDSGAGHFTHDKFREAAASLILTEDKAKFHLMVGRNLRHHLSTKLVKANIILICDQIKHGLDHVVDTEERDDFARIFLRASREAARMSAFVVASEYVDFGIGLLEGRHWRDQYDLSVDLYSTGTELAYCNGKLDRIDSMAEEVIENTRSIGDKNRVLMTQIIACAARRRNEKGIEISLDALSELGQPFPRRRGKLRILIELYKTKHAIGNKTEEDILSLPAVEDARIIASMQITYLLFPLLALTNIEASPLPALRVVQMTLQHGLSPLGGLGFLLYGICLVRLGNLGDGVRFGHLGMSILERCPSKQLEGKTLYLFWVCIQAAKESIRSTLDPIWKSFNIAMKSGDIEIAMAAGAFHCVFRIILGDPINDVVKALTKLEALSRDYSQSKIGTLICCALQLCHNLLGNAKDPLSLTGEFLNEADTIQSLKEDNLGSMVIVLFNFKYMIATLMNENRLADSLYHANKKHFKDFMMPALPIYHDFFRGLVSAALARESSGWAKRRRLDEARRKYKKLNAMLIHCPDNIINKLYLIDAELEFCKGRYSTALLKYKKSISYAEREGFVSDQALACEKTGRMLRYAGRYSEATQYLEQARLLYISWGAQLKVHQMDELIAM